MMKKNMSRIGRNPLSWIGENKVKTEEDAGLIQEQEHWLIPLSAKTESALKLKVQAFLDWVNIGYNQEYMGDISYTLCCCRTHYAIKTAIVSTDIDDMKKQLVKLLQTKDLKINHSHAMAKDYVSGKKVTWSEIFLGKDVKKVPLPSYAFEKIPHWVKSKPKNQMTRLRKWIHQNCSDRNGICYVTTITSSDKESKMRSSSGNDYIGYMLYVEMAYEAWSCFSKNHLKALQSIQWSKPIAITDDDLMLYTRIKQIGKKFYCSISNHDQIVFQCEMCQGEEITCDSNGELISDFEKDGILRELGQIHNWIGKKMAADCEAKVNDYFPIEAQYFTIDQNETSDVETKWNANESVDFKLFESHGKVAIQCRGIRFIDINLGMNHCDVGLVYTKEGWYEEKNTLQAAPWGKVLLFEDSASHIRLLSRNDEDSQIVTVKRGQQFQKINDFEFCIDPEQEEHYVQLMDQTGGIPSCVVFNWVGHDFKPEVQCVEEQLKESIYPICSFIKAMHGKDANQTVKIVQICPNVNDGEPVYAASVSLFKALHMENHRINGTCIWMKESDEQSWEYILGEMGSREFAVKLVDKKRYVLKSKIQLFDDSIHSYSPAKEGTYVITGGMGGVGFLLARHLIEKYSGNLFLIGRKKAQEVEDKIKKLQALGGKIAYISADVTNKQDIHKVTKYIEKEVKTIDGIFHCAGTSQDMLFDNKNIQDFKEVISPKIFGTINLFRKLQKMNQGFMMLFSSVSSVKGIAGQTDYGFGNGFMDYFASWADTCQSHGRVISVNWTVWQDGSMRLSKEMENRLKSDIGFEMLPSNLGMEALERIWEKGIPRCLVGYGQIDKIVRYLCDDEMYTEDSKEDTFKLSGEDLLQKTQVFIRDLFAGVFKMSPDIVDIHTDFNRYGVDSVNVMQFNSHLEQYVANTSKVLLYEYHTISELAEYLAKNHENEMLRVFSQSEKKSAKKKQSAEKEQYVDRESGWKLIEPMAVMESKEKQVQQEHDDIAIIGMSGRFPEADDLDTFWDCLQEGKDCIREIPSERWNYKDYYDPDAAKSKDGKMYSKWGGFIKDAEHFDPLFFHITPKDAELMDPQERLLLTESYHILEDAGYGAGRLEKYKKDSGGYNVGVFTAVTTMTYHLLASQTWNEKISFIPNSLQWSMANRISYALNLSGPSMPIDTACSSALTAIHLACESLMKGECRMALVEGANLYLHPARYIGMCQMNMLSPTGRCHAFGKDSDGFVPGEGVGGVLLKPLSEAKQDNDRIYAVIKGTAVNHGGMTSAYKVPNLNAQAELIRESLEKSKVDPRTIGYIEAHGTGTALGDPIEIAALDKAYSYFTKDEAFCSIGSVKSNIGHLESAAGIASLLKVILQMKNRIIAPTLHCKTMNPNIQLNHTPFVIQNKKETWERMKLVQDGQEIIVPRRAGISSFGAGGSNGHMIVEEYEDKNQSVVVKKGFIENNVFVLSAKSEKCLHTYLQRMLEFIERHHNELNIQDFLYTLQVGRNHMNYRFAAAVRDWSDLQKRIQTFLSDKENTEQVFYGSTKGKAEVEMVMGEDSKAEELAMSWVNNHFIPWEKLYLATPQIVSTVQYPFEMDRYGIPEAYQKSDPVTVKIHPLVHSNVSNLREQKFRTVLLGNEFYLRDHVYQGKCILPGAVYVEMAREAMKLSLEREIGELSQITWHKPVVFDGKPIEIYIRIVPDKDTCAFSIYTWKEKEVLHCRGTCGYKSEAQGQIQAYTEGIGEHQCHTYDKASFYGAYESIGYSYGDTMKSIQQVSSDGDNAILTAELPEDCNANGGFVLNPALLDGVFQSVSALLKDQGTEKSYMPYSVSKIEIVQSFPEKIKIFVSRRQDASDREMISFDMTVMDENETLVAVVHEFTIKAVANQAVYEQKLREMLRQLSKGKIEIGTVKQYLGRRTG